MDSWQQGDARDRVWSVVVVWALHGVAGLGLLSYQPAREVLIDAVPLMVNLVRLEEPPKEIPPPPPRPRPVPRIEPEPPRPAPAPLITAPEASPAPSPVVVAPPPPPAPLPPVAAPVVPAQPAAFPVASATPPPPVIPPGFSADYLSNPAPAYPPASRRLGEEGKVVLRVLVDPQGLPERLEVRSSSGHERLDAAALDTVRRWKFVPARQGDTPVAAWVLVPIVFSLSR